MKKELLVLVLLPWLLSSSNDVSGQPALLPACPAGSSVTPAAPPGPPPSLPAGPISLNVVGQIGGSIRAVALQGSTAYVGVGMRLIVLDVSDPAVPREVGASSVLPGNVQDIVLAGSLAYVAAGAGGFAIVDVANPEVPVLKATLEMQGYAEGLTVSGGYAYVADGPGGLRIVNVADLANPREVATAFGLRYVFGVALVGHYAYLAAAGAGLLVVDAADPTSPREVGRLDTPGYAYGIAAADQTVYVAAGWAGLRVVDTSRPWAPADIGSRETPGWAMNVTVAEGRLYVAAAEAGLRVMDISDRADPTELGGLTSSGGHAQRLAVVGRMALVADRNLGLHLADVADPAQPVDVGSYRPMGFADGVAVADNHAYVAADTYGLRLFDLADPTRPREVGGANLGGHAGIVTSASGFAFVNGFFSRSFFAVDVSDPAHATASEYGYDFGTVHNQIHHGGVLVTANEFGLRLINVSNPRSPCQLSFMNIAGKGAEGLTMDDPFATDVAVSGELAYVADGPGGLLVVDISNPREPRTVGAYIETAAPPSIEQVHFHDVALAGSLAFAVGSSVGETLRVLDISDPMHPRARGSFALPPMWGCPWGPCVAVAEHTVFIADGAAGVLAVDVRDPDQPRLAGRLNLPGPASAVVADDKYLYVAAEEAGLFIIQAVQASAPLGAPADTGVWLGASVQLAPRHLRSRLGAGTRAYQNAPREPVRDPLRLVLQQGRPRPSDLQQHPTSQVRSTGTKTCVVVTAADDGPGTLRSCLRQAASGETVTFDPAVFPPQSPARIGLLTALPPLVQGNLTLDGSNAGVILDGSASPAGTDGLLIDSDGNLIKGLQILRFGRDGIRIQGGADNVVGGDRSLGAGPTGEGNVLSGNGESGVYVTSGSTRARIVGNYVGLDVTGARALGNKLDGVSLVCSRQNLVGGLTATARNVISGNAGTDVRITGGFGSGRGNRIVGNFIGTDASGTVALSDPGYYNVVMEGGAPSNRVEGNVIVGGARGGVGIGDTGSSYNEVIGNLIGLDANGTALLGSAVFINVVVPFNKIGGSKPEERNVVIGGVAIAGTDSVVLGNFLGTDVSGTRALGSGDLGVNGRHNFVGGTSGDQGNTLVGTIYLFAGSDDNFVAGNGIGTDATGTISLGDAGVPGISANGARYNTIQGNRICGRRSDGIRLWSSANGNWIRANHLSQNSPFGVEVLDADGNRIEGNAFLDNQQNASDGGNSNLWDNGRSGNFWYDYTGTDVNGDGIGDQPYAVASNGIDRHPLMSAVISNPVPSISNLSPSVAEAGGAGFTLTVLGANFVRDSIVLWNGSSRTTTFVTSTQLSTVIGAADIASWGTSSVAVVNPSPGGGPSNAGTFAISSRVRRHIQH